MFLWTKSYIFGKVLVIDCPGGGIGIRASLRSWWEQSRGGSTPLLDTKKRSFKLLFGFTGLFILVRNFLRLLLDLKRRILYVFL